VEFINPVFGKILGFDPWDFIIFAVRNRTQKFHVLCQRVVFEGSHR
jgi:hypothetical protein